MCSSTVASAATNARYQTQKEETEKLRCQCAIRAGPSRGRPGMEGCAVCLQSGACCHKAEQRALTALLQLCLEGRAQNCHRTLYREACRNLLLVAVKMQGQFRGSPEQGFFTIASAAAELLLTCKQDSWQSTWCGDCHSCNCRWHTGPCQQDDEAL